MSNKMKNPCVPVQHIPNDKRINDLGCLFREEFRSKPSFFTRVPGRVNLIGEHIDYCGYPVLPIALEQDILVAVGVFEKSELVIRNTNKSYVDFDLAITSFQEISIVPDENGKPFWYNYVLCGIKGALDYLKNGPVKGVRLFIDGNIPPASGLSSSSALVSASFLSFLFANNINLSKNEIASLCASSERYIGTQGGGMDQAIAFLAEENCAQYITWDPLNATPIGLPEDAAFVVAHSVAEANKAATNDFNRRVIECRLAARILAGSSSEHKIVTLSAVQKKLEKSLEEMIDLVSENLPKDMYTKTDVCRLLEISEEELNEYYLTSNTSHLTEFKLKQRALHVYQEALRVENFRRICLESTGKIKSSNGTNGTKNHQNDDIELNDDLNALGQLMRSSHESLKNLYECSHKNLDRLVDLSQEINVYSRLTGAGWGGCIVALCNKKDVEKYIDYIKTNFYEDYCNVPKNKSDMYIFSTKPNFGAIIYQNN